MITIRTMDVVLKTDGRDREKLKPSYTTGGILK
jgi:hypothetical protein